MYLWVEIPEESMWIRWNQSEIEYFYNLIHLQQKIKKNGEKKHRRNNGLKHEKMHLRSVERKLKQTGKNGEVDIYTSGSIT